MPTVDFTLEDIRKVVREEVRDEFRAAFKPAFDAAFKEAFRPAFEAAFKGSFNPAFDAAFKPAFDAAFGGHALSIQADIQRLDEKIDRGFEGVNQRLRNFGEAARELLVNGERRKVT